MTAMTRDEDGYERRKGSMQKFLHPMVGCLLFALLATACNMGDTPPTSTALPVFQPSMTILPVTTTPVLVPTLGSLPLQTLTTQPPFVTAAPGGASGSAGGAVSDNGSGSLSAAGTPVNDASNVSGTCAQPTGWVAYTVQSGDTVSSLATQVGISAAQLAASNCLSNADMINVGQTIYLPSTPPSSAVQGSQSVAGGAPGVVVTATTVVSGNSANNAVSNTANSASNVSIQNLWVEPATVQNNGQYQVAYGTAVTFRVRGIANATQVAFVMQAIGSSAAPTALGTDTNLTDGVSITWAVTDANLNANVWAMATDSTGATTQSQPIVVISHR